MDLYFDEPGQRDNTVGVDGTYEYRDILIYRMKITGFYFGVCFNHWNTDALMTVERNAIVSCDISNTVDYGIFAGAERLAIVGTDSKDVRNEHALRVYQSWYGVIAHNRLSGASTSKVLGDHALKFHGPGIGPGNSLGIPAPNNGMLARRTERTVISDNIFGSSGPWPVVIGPTNAGQNEELIDIVFERNRICSTYGTQSHPVQQSLRVSAVGVTIRNNIIDATGSFQDWRGIWVGRLGAEPPPADIRLYHNTIFRSDNGVQGMRWAIDIDDSAGAVVASNNLASFPNPTTIPYVVWNASGTASLAGNILCADALFVDPDNSESLLRNFNLMAASPALGAGVSVPVYDDFEGRARAEGAFDVGALGRE